jgi:hypothetical protein
MSSLIDFFVHFVFATSFVFGYVFVVNRLKPFQKHKKRPLSTISLKLTYLFFLAAMIIDLYFLLFFQEINPEESESIIAGYELALIIILIIPHVAIYFRRKILKKRILYNYLFSFYNVICLFFLLAYFFVTPWQITV